MTIQSDPPAERSLRGFAKFALFGYAGGWILVTYLFSIVSVLSVLALLTAEVLTLVIAVRLGLAGLLAQFVGQHLAVLNLLVRSFWLRKGDDCRVTVQAAEAPGLYRLLEVLCRRAQVSLPHEVSLELSANAWVRLAGYRTGAGRTTLVIGYDLLAGLTQAEVEAVLAHEIMHAKLVQRGFNKWLRFGLGRSVQLAGGLAAQIEAARQAGRPNELAQFFFRFADGLARSGTKSVAACSRQDEFEGTSRNPKFG